MNYSRGYYRPKGRIVVSTSGGTRHQSLLKDRMQFVLRSMLHILRIE